MYLIKNVDRHSTDIATGVSTETLTEVSVDTTEIILIRPTIACEQKTYFRWSLLSLRECNVCEPERQNDFLDVKPFVLVLANQIRRHFVRRERIDDQKYVCSSQAIPQKAWGKTKRSNKEETFLSKVFWSKAGTENPDQHFNDFCKRLDFQVFSEPQALYGSSPQWSQLSCKLLHKQLCIIVLDNTATSVVLKNHPWKAVYMPFQFGN